MTTPIVYPPLHPEKKPFDPSTSVYWKHYTSEERQMALNHPPQKVALEIQLMRSEIDQVLTAQRHDPCKTPQESLALLYAISVATRTIGTLVKSQTDYKKTHHKWDALLEEAHLIAFIRTGNYRLMARMGFEVPAAFLEIEPDLMP